jgi:hypothetical protein
LSGAPTNGIFSGNGVAGNQFFPTNVLPGTHEINYTVTNQWNCVDVDTQSIVVLPCGGNNIEEIHQNIIRVFPNPTNGKFNIYSEDAVTEILITDLSGRIIYEIHGTANELDLGGMLNGTYIASVRTKEKIESFLVNKIN